MASRPIAATLVLAAALLGGLAARQAGTAPGDFADVEAAAASSRRQ
jgi:hypothetical protein